MGATFARRRAPSSRVLAFVRRHNNRRRAVRRARLGPSPVGDAGRRRERALFQRRRRVPAITRRRSALSRIKRPSRAVSRVLCRKQKIGAGGRFLPVGGARRGALVAPERLVSSFVARRQQPFLGRLIGLRGKQSTSAVAPDARLVWCMRTPRAAAPHLTNLSSDARALYRRPVGAANGQGP